MDGPVLPRRSGPIDNCAVPVVAAYPPSRLIDDHAIETVGADVADEVGADVEAEVPRADQKVANRQRRTGERDEGRTVEGAARQSRRVDPTVEMARECQPAPRCRAAHRPVSPRREGEWSCHCSGTLRTCRDADRLLRVK